jgi:GNAT superfamily N-acetyltransferase
MSSVAAVQVRPGRPGDAEQVAAVHVRSWQGAYRGLVPQDYLDRLDPADRVEFWRGRLTGTDRPAGGVVVAVAGGQVCGFAAFGPTRDADKDPGRVGELAAIYLLPGAWGKGTGRKLMSAAVERLAAAGYRQATLWVLDSNARARRFYERAGWAEDGGVQHDGSRGFPITELRYRRQLP